MEKRPFFQADMAGLGIYHTGGYGRIGVYRVKPKFNSRHQLLSDYLVVMRDITLEFGCN